jgi:hypothetical protein
MGALAYNVVTAALLLLAIRAGATLVDPDRWRTYRRPVVAVTLTALVLAGLVLQALWSGAMDALDSDPARTGWWRPVTSVFLQNGGVAGDVWNVVTIAIVAALAEWFWGRWVTVGLFLAAISVPRLLDLGNAGSAAGTDPRNFAGSSGVTYVVGATLAGALVVAGPRVRERLLALAVPALALATWFLQDNAHGLVAAEGFVLGVVTYAVLRLTPWAPRPAGRPAAPQESPRPAR